MRIVALSMALILGAAAAPADAWAQAYPSRIIKLVIPFPAGGLVDSLGRVLAESMSAELGQSIVVDNRAGAAGKIGTQAAAQSPADGYTLLLSNGTTHGTLPAIEAAFTPQKDFASVSLATLTPFILASNPTLPVTTPQDLIAYAKSKPGVLNYASPGIGSATHFAGELFKIMAGVDIVHVPYRGLAQVLQDLVANHVQLTFDSTILSMLQDKQLRAIATTGQSRSPFLPDIPTLDEAGLKGYDIIGWAGISVPRDTPAEIVRRLSAAVNAALAKPAVQERMRSLGLVPVASTPERMDRTIAEGIERYKEIARKANLSFKEVRL